MAQAQVEANTTTRAQLTSQAQWQAASILQGFDGWYRDSAVADLGRQIARVVTPAKQQMVAAQSAYLNLAVQAQTGGSVRPSPLVDVNTIRQGVTPAQTYARLGEQYRYSRSISDLEDAEEAHLSALQATLSRANVMIDTDVALSARDQSRETLQASKQVIGYRRVVHPEVSKGGTCGMCLVASTRLYPKSELMPIHARCACTVLPVTEGEDPGEHLNNLSLADLYDHAQGDQIYDLARTRYTIDHHDELGPQLVPSKVPAKGWNEGARGNDDLLEKLRWKNATSRGGSKVGRDMDARLRAMHSSEYVAAKIEHFKAQDRKDPRVKAELKRWRNTALKQKNS